MLHAGPDRETKRVSARRGGFAPPRPTPAAQPIAVQSPLQGGDGYRRDCAQFIRLRLAGNFGLLRSQEEVGCRRGGYTFCAVRFAGRCSVAFTVSGVSVGATSWMKSSA